MILAMKRMVIHIMILIWGGERFAGEEAVWH